MQLSDYLTENAFPAKAKHRVIDRMNLKAINYKMYI